MLNDYIFMYILEILVIFGKIYSDFDYLVKVLTILTIYNYNSRNYVVFHNYSNQIL